MKNGTASVVVLIKMYSNVRCVRMYAAGGPFDPDASVFGRKIHCIWLDDWSSKAVCSLPARLSLPSRSPPPPRASSARLSRRCPSSRLLHSALNSPVKATLEIYNIKPVFRETFFFPCAKTRAGAQQTSMERGACPVRPPRRSAAAVPWMDSQTGL